MTFGTSNLIWRRKCYFSNIKNSLFGVWNQIITIKILFFEMPASANNSSFLDKYGVISRNLHLLSTRYSHDKTTKDQCKVPLLTITYPFSFFLSLTSLPRLLEPCLKIREFQWLTGFFYLICLLIFPLFLSRFKIEVKIFDLWGREFEPP